MKKLFFLLLAPLLMSMQCESDDPIFGTEYFIENNSSIDLILITEEAGEILIKSQSSQFIAVATDSNAFVVPSDNIAFTEITLYTSEDGGNMVLVYEQNPIMDSLWIFEELSSYTARYRLIITDDSLNINQGL